MRIGEQVGTLGSSGATDGIAHLHFEMTAGEVLPTEQDGYEPSGPPAGWLDPFKFLNDHWWQTLSPSKALPTTSVTGILQADEPVAAGSTTSVLPDAADRDRFKINAVADHIYEIKLAGAVVDGNKAISNGFFSIRELNVTTGEFRVVSNTKTNSEDQDGSTETFRWKPEKSGEYYIFVGGGGNDFKNVSGGYSLTVTDLFYVVGTNDGPVQRDFGSLIDFHGSAVGVVNLEAPTFIADGDAEYTVSLAGVGRGLQYNIAYIIDVSGSMSGTRIADAKSAYIQLTNQLIDLGIADVATFAVIPFHSSATSYAPLTAEQAIARISSLNASGGTSFGPALTAAGNFFSSATTGQTNVAYFLSDGQGTGASDTLTNIANVQAFGIGTGVNLSTLNIIDSDDAVLLSSSSQLLNVLTGSSVDATKIDRIEITLNGNILETIASDQLTNGPLGLQFTGKISGLDVTQGAKNQISAIVYLTDGTQSGIAELSIASALNDTSVITNGTTSEIKFGALNTTFDTDLIGVTTVNLLGNNLDNTIKAFNVGGTFSSFDGNDTLLLGNYPNSTDRVIDGGDGFDVVVYTGNFIQSLVNKVGNIIKIGTNTDTLSNIEKVKFDDAILDTKTFKVSYLNSSPVIGTSGSDYLVGTDKADMIYSLGGSYDRSAGGLGADIFVFGSEALNGVRERDVILDYEVGVDAIMLTDGATVGSIRQTSTGAAIFLEGDLDAIYVQGAGVLTGNLTFVPENILFA